MEPTARRRRRPHAIPALLPLLALAGCLTTTLRVPAPPEPAMSEPEAVAQFVELLRDARARAGCPQLVWDDRAAGVAEAHSRDMYRRNYLSHTAPDGRDPFERLRDAGIRYSAAGENIAYGSHTGAGVYRQWSTSSGHRKNMLNCTYTRHGVGLEGDRWTHVLFTP